MSIHAMTKVWESSNAKGSVLLLLLAIADYAHDDGSNSYPSVATLAKKIRMTESNTHVLIKKARELGELKVAFNASHLNTNIYTIIFQKGTKFAGYKPKRKRVQTETEKGTTACTQYVSNPLETVIPLSAETSLPSNTEPFDAVAEFDALPSASAGMPTRVRTAETADPSLEKKRFIKEIAPILAEILGRTPISQDRIAARDIFNLGFNRSWLDARLDEYRNGAGAQFRNEKANAYWIKNKLEEERARGKVNPQKQADLDAARATLLARM